MPRTYRVRAVLLVASALGAVLLAGCGGGGSTPNAKGGGSLTVGSASFSEQQILAHMYADLLDQAGYDATAKVVQNRELYEPALQSGAVDVVPEYAATMADFLNKKVNGPNAPSIASGDVDATVAALKKVAEPLGLKVLTASKAVDTNAFAVKKSFADEHHLKTLSDLGASGITVTLAAGPECSDRPFCEPGLEKTYGIKIDKIDPLGVNTVQAKQAVQSGRDEMMLTLSTDATLSSFGLVMLEDDKHLQNADNVVPVVNAKSAGSPAVAEALNRLSDVLTTSDLAELDRKVDSERQKPADVARAYLKEKGLL